MTSRLARALTKHRHLQGPRVLYRDGGLGLNKHTIRDWLTVACSEANLTFKSHLAMRGAPTLAGQSHLSDHADLDIRPDERGIVSTPPVCERATGEVARSRASRWTDATAVRMCFHDTGRTVRLAA